MATGRWGLAGGLCEPLLRLVDGRQPRFEEQALPLRALPRRLNGAHQAPGGGRARGPWCSSRLRHTPSYASTPPPPAAARPADPPAPTVLATATASRSTCPRTRTAAHHPKNPTHANTTRDASPRHCPSSCTTSPQAAARRFHPAHPSHRPLPAPARPVLPGARSVRGYLAARMPRPSPDSPRYRDCPGFLRGQWVLPGRSPRWPHAGRGSAPALPPARTVTAPPSSDPAPPVSRRVPRPAPAAPAHPPPASTPRPRADSPQPPPDQRDAPAGRSTGTRDRDRPPA